MPRGIYPRTPGLRRHGKTQPRTFDYADARRMRWQGVPVREIAEHFGVTTSTIYRACSAHRRAYERDHKRARMTAAVG